MRHNTDEQNVPHGTEEQRHLQESNEALLKMAQAMAAQLQAAQQAANKAVRSGSTDKPVSKLK